MMNKKNTEGDVDMPFNPKAERRNFIKKYGKYGAVTPIALTLMMTPGQKAAAQSDGPSDAGP